MGRFLLFRIDSRLVHGQVCTRWIPEMGIKRVVIVQDEYARDPFLIELHQMVVPKGVQCDTISSEEAVKQWNQDQFGQENTIVIFQTIRDACKVMEMGLNGKEYQIATHVGAKDSVAIYKQVNVTPADAVLLQKMYDMGANVYCQMFSTDAKQDVMQLMRNKKYAKKLNLEV